MKNNRFEQIKQQLRIPVIAAPMFLVSNPKTALSCCEMGVLGSFASHSARTSENFEQWLATMARELVKIKQKQALSYLPPYAINLVVHHANKRLEADLTLIEQYKPPIVITSKGLLPDVIERIHRYGGLVFHDVASKRHAQLAIKAGADALIAVSEGAGGHTGSLNPFALVNEIKQIWQGPLILAGCISHGKDVLAAQMIGADLAYIGTRFIMATESDAPANYRQLVINSEAKDIIKTNQITGTPCLFLSTEITTQYLMQDNDKPSDIRNKNKPWRDIFSAGRGVAMCRQSETASVICSQLIDEYNKTYQNVVSF